MDDLLKDDFVSVKAVMGLLRVSENAVRKWVREGMLPHVRAGKLIRIRKNDLRGFLGEGTGTEGKR